MDAEAWGLSCTPAAPSRFLPFTIHLRMQGSGRGPRCVDRLGGKAPLGCSSHSLPPRALSRSVPLTAAWSWGLGRDRGKKSPVYRGVGQRHRPPSQGVKCGQPTGQAPAPHDGAGMRYHLTPNKAALHEWPKTPRFTCSWFRGSDVGWSPAAHTQQSCCAARAVRHCETVGAHTQPATHSGAPGTLLLPLGQHLARDPFLSKAAGFRAADTPARASKATPPSHESPAGRESHCSNLDEAGPQFRNCLPHGGWGGGPGLNLALIAEQANGEACHSQTAENQGDILKEATESNSCSREGQVRMT